MKRWFGVAGRAMGVAALGLMTGCNGFFVYPGSLNNGSSGSGNYVYVANSSTGTNSTTGSLAGFTIGTGTLTAVSGSPYALSFVPTAVAVNPANTIVFVAGSSAIYAFAIGSGGALSVLNNGSPVGLADVVSMDISPDGNWLLVLNGTALSVGEVAIDEFQITSSQSVLTQPAFTYYAASSTAFLPRALKFAPNGQAVGVALGTAGDLVYTFTTAVTSGALTNPQAISVPSAPMSDNGLAWSPDSSTLYVARSNSTSAGEIAKYSIVGGMPGSTYSFAASGVQPTSVAVNAAGTDVYVGNQSDSTVSAYSVPLLTSLGTIASGSSVTALAADRTGDYLLAVALGGSPDLKMYSFDSVTAGELDPSTTIATGVDPAGAVALAVTH